MRTSIGHQASIVLEVEVVMTGSHFIPDHMLKEVASAASAVASAVHDRVQMFGAVVQVRSVHRGWAKVMRTGDV